MGFLCAGSLITKSDIGEALSIPYASTVSPWYHVPSVQSGFIVGYYINPNVTPISKIDFAALKSAGITDIYVLAKNDNYSPVLKEAKSKADAVGIRTNAWVYPGFKYASQVADMKIGVQLDVETHNMSEYVSEIKSMRSATKGVTFSVCVKPELWDGKQYYNQIAPYCDYIVPMLYIGDYKHGLTGLKNWVRVFNYMYPRKIVAGLQTYKSDKNLTPKKEIVLLTEIKAVQPYTRGVILFRYGLSKFNG